tara:strand:+ start:1613 stop:2236 length:624 start_codon:yes stop_codon:yes gene_type:complete
MAYFNKVPNLLYLKYTSNPYDGQWIEIKNIFSRIKIADDVKGNVTAFEDYFIEDGDRPDSISFEMYDDPGYDWTILLMNNIVNLHKDWPKAKAALDAFVSYKYQNPEEVHHYETLKQEHNGKTVLEAGIKVDESYQYVTPAGLTLTKAQSRISVSNYSYEIDLNEKRREIVLLKPEFIPQFNQIVRDQMKYTPSTEFIRQGLKVSNN